jgi:hypothetical protein
MGARADYNLAQAVAMVNLIATQRAEHWKVCEDCSYADMRRYEPDFEPEEEFCEIGLAHYRNCAKWKRRCRYAARREGVKMTI